jgi:hypothetical protein
MRRRWFNDRPGHGRQWVLPVQKYNRAGNDAAERDKDNDKLFHVFERLKSGV